MLIVRFMQGRPKSGPEDKFRLNPVVPRLSELLGITVMPRPTCARVNGVSEWFEAASVASKLVALVTTA